jgi:hypothetical protein|tara:strand:+ start:357 stop:1025 length:669 start_codon:yes stop_codon:yes gene_type:complete
LVSEAALARKKRFTDAKAEHGGDVAGLQKHIESLDWNLWHEEDGTIISLSKEWNEQLAEKYETAKFSNEQVNILIDKNWNLYRIRTDKHNKHVKFIEVRPVVIDKISTENDFLFQVDKNSKAKYDIKLSLSSKALTVTAHKDFLEKYAEIDIADAVINGRKQVTFYLTSKNDPSFMFHTITISLYDILNSSKVVKETETDFRGCSIFTLKLFDNYNYAEEKK